MRRTGLFIRLSTTMARQLRIEYTGAFYHVTSRGNEKKEIFFAREDYLKFKYYLKNAMEKYSYFLHCYVLMTNHYHLLLETPRGNLSKVMHFINSSYSNYINKKKERSGHLFQGRYKAILIETETYLLELSRYIHLNPVRAALVEKPELYPYSSYQKYITANIKVLVTVTKAYQRFSERLDADEDLKTQAREIASKLSELLNVKV